MPTINTQTIQDKITGETLVYESPDWSEEIARGMEFLDRKSPGWEDKIDPLTIELHDPSVCICGQVFAGHFDEGVKLLAAELNSDRDTVFNGQTCDYGFNIHTEYGARDFIVDDAVGGVIDDDYIADFITSARLLDDWAMRYIEQHKNSDDTSAAEMDSVLWSALTEQWIAAIISRRAARARQTESVLAES